MASEMILATLSQLQGFGEKFIAKIGEVSERVRTLEAVGAQANLIERILVNGDPLSIGANKTVNIPVPTRVNQLENDASYQENVIERIQVNGVTQGITGKTVNVHMPTAVSELTNDENYQTNVLEGVKVNGTALTVDAEKNVNVSVPTKVSQLTNDKTYQTKTEVENTVKTAVAGSKHTSFQKVSSVPAAADAKEDVMYLVMNSVTKHYDIYAKIADDAGNFKMELLDDITVDLSGYVQKEAGKGLSHNDFTDALLAKLKANGVQLAVFSNKADALAKEVVKDYFGTQYFTIVRGQMTGVAPKPAAEGTNALLQALHADPASTLYVGDSNVDVETAHNANLPCCGAVWGFRTREELNAAGAEYLAENSDELYDVIMK